MALPFPKGQKFITFTFKFSMNPIWHKTPRFCQFNI